MGRRDGNRGRARAAALIAVLLALSGCESIPFIGNDGGALSSERARALEDRLGEFQTRFRKEIAAAAISIERGSDDPNAQLDTLYFQLLIHPYPSDAAFGPDPLTSLLDLWSLVLQTRAFFETGPGREIFGAGTPRMLDAARGLETEIEGIAARALDAKALASARGTVAAFAAEYPASWPFHRDSIRSYLETRSQTVGVAWLFDKSLSPLRAIGGLDQTAVALHEISRSADELTAMARELPERMRLQSRILLYEAEQNPGIASSIASLDRVGRSGESLVGTVETLPERLGAELESTIREIESASPELRATIAELRGALGSLEGSLAAAKGAAVGIEGASGALEGALVEFRGVLDDLRGDPDESAPSPTGSSPTSPAEGEPSAGKPFDIDDYTRAAEAIGVAAGELRSALAELRALAVANESAAAIGRATGAVEGLAVRVALILVAGFAACLALLLAMRIAARRVGVACPPATGSGKK